MKTKTSFFVLDLSISAISDLRPIVVEIRRHDRDLGEQLRRALSSVALNIAEGNRSQGGHRIARFSTAAGSVAESRAALRVAVAWQYVDANAIVSGRAIEQCVAARDFRGGDVAPSDGDTKRRASFLVRAERGGEASESMTAAASVAFRKIEHDRAESATKLFTKVSIVLTNTSNERTKESNGLNRNIESLKGRFRLHARPQRKNRDDAKL